MREFRISSCSLELYDAQGRGETTYALTEMIRKRFNMDWKVARKYVITFYSFHDKLSYSSEVHIQRTKILMQIDTLYQRASSNNDLRICLDILKEKSKLLDLYLSNPDETIEGLRSALLTLDISAN